MKTPSECPTLTELADACMNGACNTGALIRALAKAIEELPTGDAVPSHPAVKIILGQITFLAGETLGPSIEALDAYRVWRHS